MSVAMNFTEQLPKEWSDWVATNIMRGISKEVIIQTLKANNFSDTQIQIALNNGLNIDANENKQNIRKLPSKVKQWVGANLLQGVSKDSIAQVLLQQGYTHAEVLLELETACKSPYLQAGVKSSQILNKREWLLQTCDDLARLDPGYNQKIDVIDTPSFDVFIKDYYSKHKPVVLRKGIDHWPALKKWNPQYFADILGDSEIQVQFDRESDTLFERHSDKYRKSMLMSEFVNMIENDGESNNYYMTANNTQQNVETIRPALDDIGDFGQGYRQLLDDDAAFSTYFWMGPKGTFTPLHHDLTNNMLVQVYGRKKVTLIPAWQVPWIYNDLHVYSEVDFPNFDIKTHPLMQHVTPIEVTIEAGDALFIPIAWWHCVEGLDKSISISFTNFNAPNNYAESFKKAQG
ncbi:cupin-like domain-containing protein [Psychrobacter sp. ANT_WB68]|uniref:cupin-like domain-containing protein n=1 Tax=Psychrobacter sp. ANT_WB68 TaxID=2597355 RepID=UPI0011F0EEB4|nr:cupin-like domain-containing protein [Psychrobacter sp. ANT_WB68]KAA0912753.1 cupin-like domain-containing protein [Psychrobacter sp. ANT_WB68]